MTNKIYKFFKDIRENYKEMKEKEENKKVLDDFLNETENIIYIPRIRNDTWEDSNYQVFM